MFAFGSGVLLGTRTDVANATPVNFGLVQEVQLDLQFTAKELYGQYQFPVAIARGQDKATGKAKMAQISGLAFNNLFFGGALTSGQLATSFGEAGTVPGSSAYTVTVANSAAWQDDYGVVYSGKGQQSGTSKDELYPNPLDFFRLAMSFSPPRLTRNQLSRYSLIALRQFTACALPPLDTQLTLSPQRLVVISCRP